MGCVGVKWAGWGRLPEERGPNPPASAPRRAPPAPGAPREGRSGGDAGVTGVDSIDSMILPQVHLRKPCYDFSFL